MHLSFMGNPRGVRRDFAALEQRRFEGLKLLRQGLNQSEVARRVKVCNQTVSRWAKALAKEGERGLKAAGRAGRMPLLDARQRQHLVSRLLEGTRTLVLDIPARATSESMAARRTILNPAWNSQHSSVPESALLRHRLCRLQRALKQILHRGHRAGIPFRQSSCNRVPLRQRRLKEVLPARIVRLTHHGSGTIEESRRVLARHAVILEVSFQVNVPAQQTELVHLHLLAFRVELLPCRTELAIEVSGLHVLRDKPEQKRGHDKPSTDDQKCFLIHTIRLH